MWNVPVHPTTLTMFPDWMLRPAQMRKIIHFKIDSVSEGKCSRALHESGHMNWHTTHKPYLRWIRALLWVSSKDTGMAGMELCPAGICDFHLNAFWKHFKIPAHTISGTKGTTSLLYYIKEVAPFRKKSCQNLLDVCLVFAECLYSSYIYAWGLTHPSFHISM